MKLHEITADAVREARIAAGDDVEITLDVNCPRMVREALDMSAKLRPFNLLWLEEPIWPQESFDGLARLRRESGMPMAAPCQRNATASCRTPGVSCCRYV
ncbi:enolase C-terminal domain-like protein [Bradyrhizobium sp. 6(2017)]|uniref:enolase C-terminal domain-like protein n=1 Tax=Bradyrhizobium sp. 6(2017) TaxID=1197460 RepID=UPI00197AD11B